MNAIRTIPKLYRFGGYLALWPSLYALGVYVLAGTLLDNDQPDIASIVYILLCAHSCYLLDRVKIADHRQDPADALALPERAMLFARFAKPIRVLIICELIAASITGLMIQPVIGVIPLIALAVVHLYAGRKATPRSPRLKDLPVLKAFFVASGHLALSLAVIWANTHELFSNLGIFDSLAIIGVWLIVAGDAVLCDIDDHDADMMYSTKSLAVLLGSRSAWWSALGMLVLGTAMMALAHSVALAIGTTLIITTLITRKNTNHRDLVDVRLLLIVLIWMSIL